MRRQALNWQTTLLGLVGAIVIYLAPLLRQSYPELDAIINGSQALAFALLGFFSKDAKTGSSPGG